MTAGDVTPENAREWEFAKQDIYRVAHFSLAIGRDLKVETDAADLGIGHCADGAVWAVLIPRERGTLTSSVTNQAEAIAHVWLRFHPGQVDNIFSPASVSADGNASLISAMRAIASSKMTSSWQANGKAMIPEPKDLTVYVDTKAGAHRFFVVDTLAKTADYIAAFNGSADSSPMSWASAPPVVIKTFPEAGADNVPPGVTEIQATFSKEMRDGSWSWCDAWENSTPEGVEKPKYDADQKTCVLKVKLEPGKTYGYWLNTKRFQNFKDKDGHAAVPYLLTFQTAANGQPSPGLPASAAAPINPATGLPVSAMNSRTPESAINASFQTDNEVRQLISAGQYEDALQRLLAFHDQYKASGSLIPLLANWVELGRRFPKAKAALIEIRDHDVGEFAAGRGYSDLFSEVNSINGCLNQDEATYALFKTIRAQDPQLAQQCYFYVESLLVAKGEYQWCYDHMGDPQGRFGSIQQALTMQLDSQKRMAESRQMAAQHIAEMNQKLGRTNSFTPHDPSAMMKQSAENGFVNQARQLIEIFVATGHQTDAEKIRDQAGAILDDARLKSAVTDATEKIRNQRVQNGSSQLAPPASPAAQKLLAPIPSANDLPGTLTFHGRYKHRSRGTDIELPSELWIKETPNGGITALAQLPFSNSTELADSKQHRIAQSASGNQPAYQIDLELGNGQVRLNRHGVRQDCDGKELKVPEGAWFDPNTRPDSYCAANVLLRAFAVGENETKEFRAYDWDNTGDALVDYTIRIKNAGKERVEVPAGTFEANHLVLTQLTSANTWFKKSAGHVTDFWVLDNHVIVRILRHREPYELVLLDYSVPEKLSGSAGKP